jgi:hypothetical protein
MNSGRERSSAVIDVRDETAESAYSDGEFADSTISDSELTSLALAADPDSPLDPDALPLALYLSQVPSVLPSWYMPQVVARSGNRWRALAVLAIITAFVLIEALGLCNTYGQLGLV